MSAKFQAIRHLSQTGLSRKIVLWVFASILLIEAIILMPSIYRRQQELLQHLSDLSKAQVEGGMRFLEGANLPDSTTPVPSDTRLLAQLERLVPSAVVRGGALYDHSGNLIGTFGEAPALSIQQVNRGQQAIYDRVSGRYDAIWSMQPLKDKTLIIRHDATSVQQELWAFMGRIALLVMIISVFVTLVTLFGLAQILITPIMTLRNDLIKAGQAVRQDQPPPEFNSLQSQRQDELGEVIAAFDQMYQQVTAAISERKQAEAALRQSEEKFSKAFRASPSAILISSLDSGRLIEFNDSFLQLYGATSEAVLGQTALDLKLWTTPEHRTELVQQLRRTGAVHNLEYTFHNQRGEPRAILFSAELIYLDGEECLVSVANDITERKQAERTLERLAEIGELAAMIVHEVRNPLTTVLMGLQSFQSLELSERSRLRLNLATEEAYRLQRLLNEILQYTRCQTLQTEMLDLNNLIQEMLGTISTLSDTPEQGIEFEALPGSVIILGDRDKLKQVFINLISNACEATTAGKIIRCTVETCARTRTVHVHIYNAGDPIPAAVLSRLTQPFFTTKSNGNGLGLAIVKRIVEAHQGELNIDSSEAMGGTTVSIALPYVNVSTENLASPPTPPFWEV